MLDYRVDLDIYHGPLDLLLYLIKRDEIDIHDIPIAHITEQYLRHVRSIRHLDINLAGEFLVMAATLMEIKSAMMSPPEVAEGDVGDSVLGVDDADAEDPRYELVQQLLAYKRYKDAAYALDRRREMFATRFPLRPAPWKPDKNEDAGPPPLDLEDVSAWDLLEAFSSLMEQINLGQRQHQIVDDDTPLELHQADIQDRLQREGPMSLQAMFVGRRSVGELIGLFLATLELIRQRRVRATQDKPGTELMLEVRPEGEWLDPENDPEQPPREEADPKNPNDYDWPDAQERDRYVRRQDRRSRGEFIEEDDEYETDLKALEEEEEAETDLPEAKREAPAEAISEPSDQDESDSA